MNKRKQGTLGARLAVATAITLALAGCGGGGGDDSTPVPAVTLVLDAGNSETVAHASSAAILASSPAQSLPVSGLAADRSTALGQSSLQQAGWLGRIIAIARQPQRVKAWTARSSRAQPLAVVGPIEEPCTVSGTISVTFDDRDNDEAPSVGDVLTLVLDACMEDASETLDGVAVVTYSEITANSVGALMKLTDLSDTTERHSSRMNGSMQLSYRIVDSNVEVTRLAAVGAVVVDVSTHLPFDDTVTLADGFVQELTYDAAAYAPGSATPGLSTLTVSGMLDSAAAGGTVEVSSGAEAPIKTADASQYPYAGELVVQGKSGTLVLTAVSEAVRLELDANDDGTPETSDLHDWDWLY